METVFEGKTCRAEFMPERKLVFCSLIGPADAAEHKAMDRAVLAFVTSDRVVAFAHDFRQMTDSVGQLNDWLLETFRPALALGLRYHALVMGGEFFKKIITTQALSQANLIQYSIFDSREKAEHWIDAKLLQQGGFRADGRP
jgi:hypothetical protein